MIVKDWVTRAAFDISLVDHDDPEIVATIIRQHCPFRPDVAYMPVIRVAPGHVQDWASKVAEYLSGNEQTNTERVAAVIATFAEPLLNAVRASRRDHSFECARFHPTQCICGANEHNTMLDEALR